MLMKRQPGAYNDPVKGDSSNCPFWPGTILFIVFIVAPLELTFVNIVSIKSSSIYFFLLCILGGMKLPTLEKMLTEDVDDGEMVLISPGLLCFFCSCLSI
jgi:hypothetical protein